MNKAEISERYYRVELEQYITKKRTIIDDSFNFWEVIMSKAVVFSR